jgi:hypothetical protein
LVFPSLLQTNNLAFSKPGYPRKAMIAYVKLTCDLESVKREEIVGE